MCTDCGLTLYLLTTLGSEGSRSDEHGSVGRVQEAGRGRSEGGRGGEDRLILVLRELAQESEGLL